MVPAPSAARHSSELHAKPTSAVPVVNHVRAEDEGSVTGCENRVFASLGAPGFTWLFFLEKEEEEEEEKNRPGRA